MKTLFITILLFYSFPSFAQIKVLNKDLVKPDTNILYRYTYNHLVLTGIADLKNISIVSSNRSAITKENNEIVVRPMKAGFDTLKFFKGDKIILSRIYEVLEIGELVTQIAFTSDTIISKKRIIANPILSLKFVNTLYVVKSTIYSFHCFIFKQNGQKLHFVNHGARLSGEIITAINLLSPGDKIVIENIGVGFAPSYCPRAMGNNLNIVIQ